MLTGFVIGCAASGAIAAEGGASFYVPGFLVPDAGVLPPPGVYFDSTGYFYHGKLIGERPTQLGGNIIAGAKVDLKADFLTVLWVTPVQILGGNLAFSLSEPFGDAAVTAGTVISGPIINRLLGGPLALVVRDSKFDAGDPILTAAIGWHAGNWHWKLAAAASLPAGAYDPGRLSNIALNRPVGDFTAGLTYLDKELGIEFSTIVGYTVNGENPATDYRTGQEFHVDVSLSKNLTKEFSVGVLASHYQQVTGDSGPGARLGPYKGRDTAVGGTAAYTFTVGQIPVTTRVKVLQELEVENRFKGTIGFAEISFPLWVQPSSSSSASPAASAAEPLRTRF